MKKLILPRWFILGIISLVFSQIKSMNTVVKKLFLFLVTSLLYTTLYAQWSTDSNVNTAICTAANQQYLQKMVSDASGGAILTWMEYNSSINERSIYAQRINAAGMIQWGEGGVPICTVLGNQQDPQITTDGSGGAIIAWHDNRIYNIPEIYAQRINANGQVQWTADGVSLGDGIGQSQAQLISDKNGGALVTWKTGTTSYSRIKAQRINNQGQLQWVTGGVEVSTSNAPEVPQIISDGADGAIISWNEWVGNYPVGNHDIYAQRINAAGLVQWGSRGTAICSATGFQLGAQLTTDGNNGAIISWRDFRNSSGAIIYAQKVSSSGIVQWALDGVIVAIAVSAPSYQNLISDGQSGAFITWNDNTNIITQHLASAGTRQWGVNGKTVGFGQYNAPQITGDGSTGSVITWSNGFDILAQRLDVNGNFLWGSSSLKVCTALEIQINPQIIPNGNGDFIISWEDNRNSTLTESDLYGQLVNANGTLILSNQDKIMKPISIYPNPTKDIINIKNTSNLPINKIIITDITGQKMMEQKNISKDINVSQLQHGLYILQLQSNEKTFVAKFIKN